MEIYSENDFLESDFMEAEDFNSILKEKAQAFSMKITP